MRNNEERLGTKKSPSSPAAKQAANTGPAPLEFVRPTTILSLPSKGKFYPEGHPLHNQETIEIRQMTTAEEDVLTNPALLKNGTALDKFLERILIDSKVSPEELLVGDKNAVLIQARIDGYGSNYETTVQCPACSDKQKFSFDLNSSYQELEVETPDNVVSTGEGTYIVTLDNGWEVEFRAMTGADENKIAKAANNKKKAGLAGTPVQDQLNTIIVSVSGHTDRSTISKAVRHMNGKDSRLIRESYKKVIPNVELRSDFECRSCGASTEMEVPLNVDFFWART
tara:strand:+ start:3790 stop:4638 length:849 start_codon:yes stop_codon:yes gene_type:complete